MSSSSSSDNIDNQYSFQIKKYIDNLISNNKSVTIIDFIKYVAFNIYKLDINFMDELLELMIKDDITIHHKYLIKFGVVGTKNIGADIKKIIERNELIDGFDYNLLSQVGEQVSHGGHNKINYYFHPDAFGTILASSKNTKQYRKYFALCQLCIKYHSNYQLQMKQSEVSRMIDELKETRLELKESNKKLENQNKKLTKLENQNDDLLDKVESLEDDNQLIKTKLSISTEDRVLNPNDKSKLEYFILLKSSRNNPDYKYYVIRCQERCVKANLHRLKKQNYKPILTLDNIMNAITFFNYIKEKLENNLDTYYNNLNLIDITEQEFINNVKILYEDRKNIIVDSD